LGACKQVGAPVVITLAGGYATDTRDTVAVHFNTAKTLVELSDEI
jgi:hypothetical protein